MLRTRKKKRFKSEKRGAAQIATAPGELLVMDFIHDSLADGRSFRTLNLTDSYTRQCLAQEVDTSIGGERVVRVLERVVREHKLPAVIRVDNGPEFRSKAVDLWASKNKVKLEFIEPGKPTQNGQIESFNGRFRAECLNQEWFSSLDDARSKIESWRTHYNSQRPHSSLGYLPPDLWTQKYHQNQKSLML